MKKGVVFQITGNHALLLEKGGRFTRVPAKEGWAVGDVVAVGKKPRTHNVRFWIAHAAGILLMLFTIQFGFNYYYGEPATYVSVDVNPSVEIAVNRMDQVISVTACNEDGARVLEGLELEGKPYTEAVQMLMEADGMQEYLEDDPFVMVSVSSEGDRANELAMGLNGLSSQVKTLGDDLHYRCSVVAWDLVEKAHELGTTVGRLALFEQVEGESGGLSLEEFLERPISSIMELL